MQGPYRRTENIPTPNPDHGVAMEVVGYIFSLISAFCLPYDLINPVYLLLKV